MNTEAFRPAPSLDMLRDAEANLRRLVSAKYDAEKSAGLHDRMEANAARKGYRAFDRRDAVKDQTRAFQCLNPECMAVFYVRGGEAINSCRACASEQMQYGFVEGTLNEAACNSLCTHATGTDCECSCGGTNHGASWMQSFTFPRNIAAFRAELADRKAARAEINQEFTAEEIGRLAEEHAKVAEYFDTALADAIEAENEKRSLIIDGLLRGPKPQVLMTKSKKPAADQYFEGRVTKAKLREKFSPYSSYGETEPTYELGLTCEDVTGKRFWCHVDGWLSGPQVSLIKEVSSGHVRWNGGKDKVPTSLVHEGDFIRIKARVKGEETDIRFLSHAKLEVWVSPYLTDAVTA